MVGEGRSVDDPVVAVRDQARVEGDGPREDIAVVDAPIIDAAEDPGAVEIRPHQHVEAGARLIVREFGLMGALSPARLKRRIDSGYN